MRYTVLPILAFVAAPVAAQDETPPPAMQATEQEEAFVWQSEEEEILEDLNREMTEAFSVFADVFAADPLTPEQEARLPLAKRMTDRVFPEGSFSVIMDQSMEPMMDIMMATVTEDPRTQLSELTGIPAESLGELEDDTAQEALTLLDPQHEERNARLGEIVIDMIGDLYEAIEPSYREALARAFTTRFESGEMEELLVFFDTPIGGKFAKESFLVQYDPQMMGIMEAMGPAMGEIMPDMMTKMIELAADYPEGRTFKELSGAEKSRLARMLDKSEAELEALAPDPQVLEEVEEGVI